MIKAECKLIDTKDSKRIALFTVMLNEESTLKHILEVFKTKLEQAKYLLERDDLKTGAIYFADEDAPNE